MKIAYLLSGFMLLLQVDARIESATTYIKSSFGQLSAPELFALSIGAPEISRYEEIQDLLETEILEVAYVDHGLMAFDFSIGHFQMKPSFVERLEKEIKSNCELQEYLWLTEFGHCDLQQIRRTRLKRISAPDFILGYLLAFEQYCRLTFRLDDLSYSSQLKFIATAYNLGFDQSKEEILSYQPKRYFPYGPKFEGEQHAFADLSLAIYQHLIRQL
ncbi:MAG: hypothetical protein RIA69_13290 [Cyclobacteriaceae bacterium]